jgi:hypothetical protein
MRTGKAGNTLMMLGGIGALVACFMPWLSIPFIGEDFSYSYTPFQIMANPNVLPSQQLAPLLLLLEPIGALLLIIGPQMDERKRKGALRLILAGNALEAVALISFLISAIGQESFPSSPSIGFWTAAVALLLSLAGLARGLRAHRAEEQSFAKAASYPKADPQQIAPGA